MTEPLQYRPSSSAVYYTPPKRRNAAKTLAGVAVGGLFVVAGAIVYAKLQPEMSSPYLRIGAVFAASVATGILAMLVVNGTNVRSQAIAALIGALFGLLALYVMWVVWICDAGRAVGVVIRWQLLVKRPRVLWFLIRQFNETGTWSYRGNVARGVPLAIFWLIEAGAILGTSVAIAVKSISQPDAPICRECGSKCRSVGRLPRFDASHESAIVTAVESRDFAKLATFPQRAHEDDPEISLRLVSCPTCKQTHVLTVSRIAWHVLPSTRVVQVKSVPLVNQMLVTLPEAKQIEVLQSLFESVDDCNV
jgi:hypothetical protein